MASNIPHVSKAALTTIRKHLRSFIKVIHPDVTPLASVEQKKKNEQSLGELNNFLDLTNTLCDPADDTSSSIGNDHLNAPSVSKFGINQTNYKFLFHVPLPDNNTNIDEDDNNNNMKELNVKIKLPEKIHGLKSLNDNQKRLWLGLVANGTMDLLNGAAIPIDEELKDLRLSTQQQQQQLDNNRNVNNFSTNSPITEKEEDEFQMESVDFDSLINEQVEHYEKHGFQNVKESSNANKMRSKQLYKRFDKPKQRYKRIRKIIENGLYLTDDINDDEARRAHEYYSNYLYEHFDDLQVWNDLWDDSRICILKGIDKAEIQEHEGVLCLPFNKKWGKHENQLLLEFIIYGGKVHGESMRYTIDKRL